MSDRTTYWTGFLVDLERFQQTYAAEGVATMEAQRLANKRQA